MLCRYHALDIDPPLYPSRYFDHTNRHQLDTPDRFSVSKLLRTPQMYSLPGNEYWGWPTFNDLIDGNGRGHRWGNRPDAAS